MAEDSKEIAALLRVVSIEVEGLFKLYHHRIELNLHERVTILHGPNGVGKTMLLRMVDHVLSGQWLELCAIPFRTLRVIFTDRTEIRVKPFAPREHTNSNEALEVNEDGVSVALVRPRGRKVHKFKRPLQLVWPHAALTGLEQSHLHALEEQEEYIVASRTSSSQPDFVFGQWHQGAINEPDWLTTFRSQVDTHLIAVERLTRQARRSRRSENRLERTVVRYAADLAEQIKQTQAQYGRRSQVLDQSFPQRLIESATVADDLSVLRIRMEALDKKRASLTEIGLLDDTSQGPFKIASLDQISPAQRDVMALYARDTGEKLAVFDDLADRIKLLLDIVNAKYRHKKLRIDRRDGLVVEPVGYQGPTIDLDALSSGEQHELVLHYDLLFRIRPNTLVLIDEPELSLHVVWQKRFLPDLLRIVEVARIDVLVATHSPYIIGERRDLMVGLSDELP